MKTRIAWALRHKIMAAFALFAAGGLILTGITYQRHLVIREKLQVIEDADDLINSALEVRRYEKNYFLYGGDENFSLMMGYLNQVEREMSALELCGHTEDPDQALQNCPYDLLQEYREAVVSYGGSMQAGSAGSLSNVESTARRIRELGHELTVALEELVRDERRSVDRLVTHQKNILFVGFGVFFLLMLGAAYYLFFLIFSPLSRIEKAAEDVIRGRVREIPRFTGSPEVQSLISALNMMIKELDKKSEQLIQQEKMAALGTLTSGVAHELNNPLSNISSSTQILMEELGDGEVDADFQGRLLGGIEQQVEKARDIVRSLLEFAREREFEPLPTDLLTLVEKTVRLVKGEVPGNVQIEVDIPEGLEVEVDQRRMSQALMNLMLNGMQAMEKSGGTLSISADVRPEAEEAVLVIHDEGTGIPAEQQSQVFDPFFSTKNVGQGTGLGLYVTYGIIQKHGGRINLSSEPGEGATFVITMPVRQGEGEVD
jgi:signal transduction histidine kinase